MNALIDKLSKLNTGTKATIDVLVKLFTKTEFKKGWMFGNGAWQSVPMLYYISSGLLKGSVEYREVSYPIWMLESGFLIPSTGFLSKKGILEVIEVLKPTKAYALNLLRAEKLAEDDVNLYKMLLEIYEENLLESRNRELMLHIPNAKERLAFFIEHNPEQQKAMTDDQVAQLLR
uniref:hypothetical protein n=1 Tax=Pedobacter sp. ASV28 TaxID=2795123 RepID=UPI0018EDD8F7